MKRKLVLALFPLLTMSVLGQVPIFKVKYSEPLAVFVFIESLSAFNGDNPFKSIFNSSDYNNEDYQELITQFDDLELNYTYHFTEFPSSSKMPVMSGELLKRNLLVSDDLNDFKLRSVGLITNKSLSQLSSILTKFTPVYDNLIYEPSKDNLKLSLRIFQNTSIQKEFPHILKWD